MIKYLKTEYRRNPWATEELFRYEVFKHMTEWPTGRQLKDIQVDGRGEGIYTSL